MYVRNISTGFSPNFKVPLFMKQTKTTQGFAVQSLRETDWFIRIWVKYAIRVSCSLSLKASSHNLHHFPINPTSTPSPFQSPLSLLPSQQNYDSQTAFQPHFLFSLLCASLSERPLIIFKTYCGQLYSSTSFTPHN
mmetsp:Transcript_5938/g.22543  ORF Transcript_5938/g.22543 Transcript_5938/m.22543 type:complete len:136 (+) Transcript_5938:403-810(+)